jgi:glutamate racemase
MNNRPIGIFDSGLGGLTVMSEIVRLLPHEDVVYFGDTARVPYGSKSKEAVTRFSLEIAAFLATQKVKMIVVACNTASAFALETLRHTLPVPVLGVIEPGARTAATVTATGRVGVVGTQGTINSASYTNAIQDINPKIKVVAQACPLFVPLVEEGWLDHPVTLTVAQEYLAPVIAKNVDTIVLGCTHYPLIKKVIRKVAGPSIRLIDSATATAHEVVSTLHNREIACSSIKKGSCRFFVSDAPEKFRAIGRRFLGRDIAPVKKINPDGILKSKGRSK